MDETLIKGGGGEVNNDPNSVEEGKERSWQRVASCFPESKVALSF